MTPMKEMTAINIMICTLDPRTSLISWEDVQEWKKENPEAWADWDEARCNAESEDLIRRYNEGERAFLVRLDAMEHAVDFSKAGLERIPNGVTTSWRSQWFKLADAVETANRLIEVTQKVLDCLKDGGFMKAGQAETK